MGQKRDEIQKIESAINADTVLFFDMDGTLIDTNLANFLSYKKAINSVTKSDKNLTFNPDKRFNRSNLKIAVPNLTETEYERIIQEKEEYYDDFLHETKLIEEVADILFKYSKSHKTVLVTSVQNNFQPPLVKVGLSPYLQVAKQNQTVYGKSNITGSTVGSFAKRGNQKSCF